MSSDRKLADRVAGDLGEIRDWWPELLTDSQPGTARRWQQAEAVRVQVDTRCPGCGQPRMLRVELDPRYEQLGRRMFCPRCDRDGGHGASPAPGRVDVLDAGLQIRVGLAELVLTVAHELRRRGPQQRTVIPIVDWLLAQLPAIAAREELLESVAREAGRLETRLRQALGRPERVGRLWVVDAESGARQAVRCPACRSASLLVLHDRALIVCANPRCARMWHEDLEHGRGQDGWRWLAQTLTDQLPQREATG